MAILESWWIWLLLVALTFGIHELWAGMTGNQMLTQYVRASTKRFPILIFWMGVCVGALCMHFWGDQGKGL
jgi:hypothetical protein